MPIPPGPYSSWQKWEYFQSGYKAIYLQQLSLGVDASERTGCPSAGEINDAWLAVSGEPGDCQAGFPEFTSQTVTAFYYQRPPPPPPGTVFDQYAWARGMDLMNTRINLMMWNLGLWILLQDCLQFGTCGKGGGFTLS